MIDLILVVKDAETWHRANLHSNPHHYSWILRESGLKALMHVQRSGAAVLFNTGIPMAGRVGNEPIVIHNIVRLSNMEWSRRGIS